MTFENPSPKPSVEVARSLPEVIAAIMSHISHFEILNREEEKVAAKRRSLRTRANKTTAKADSSVAAANAKKPRLSAAAAAHRASNSVAAAASGAAAAAAAAAAGADNSIGAPASRPLPAATPRSVGGVRGGGGGGGGVPPGSVRRASVLDFGPAAPTPSAAAAAALGRTPGSRFFSRHRSYSRPVAFQPDFEAALEAEKHGPDQVMHLCGRSWQLFRVSPLFGLKQGDPAFLRAWEKTLARDMTAAKSVVLLDQEEDLGMMSEEDRRRFRTFSSALTAEVEAVPGLRATGTDATALRISVTCRTAQNGQRGSKKVTLVSAFLLATDAREEAELAGGGGGWSEASNKENSNEAGPSKTSCSSASSAAVLPVLLLWGARPLASALVDNLQRCFDCVVGRVPFAQEDLRWMSAMWAGMDKEGQKEDEEEEEEERRKRRETTWVRLTYLMPPQGVANKGGRGTVEVELKQAQVAKLWDR